MIEVIYGGKDLNVSLTMPAIESRVPLQQQQLLYNGKEMRNSETLSGLGVADGDLVMMVSNTSSAPPPSSQEVLLNRDGSEVNPAAFQQQIRENADAMAQLFQSDPELAQVILGNDLNKLQTVLRARHNERSEARRQQEKEMASCSPLSKRKVISS